MSKLAKVETVGPEGVAEIGRNTEMAKWVWLNCLLEGGMKECEQDEREATLSAIFEFLSSALKKHPGYPE